MNSLSPTLRRLGQSFSSEIGAALALVALTMVVLLGMVALAIDVGMLMAARTEAQTVADASPAMTLALSIA